MQTLLMAWSGGKDSTLALARLRQSRQCNVVGLLTTVSPAEQRVSIHGIRLTVLHAQAAELGLPAFEAPLATNSSNADYDAAWAAALQRARSALGTIDGIAYGDLYLEQVRQYREQQGLRLGYTPVFPLWGQQTAQLAREFIAAGYEAYLTCVDTTQLAAQFAGRRFDLALLEELPASVDPCGEGGEFHTCVVAGPIFRRPIAVSGGGRIRREQRFEFYDLVPVSAPPAPPACGR